MKRAVLLFALLLLAAGYVFLQTTTPAPKFAAWMPGGAMLYLETPDFARLVRDWDGSKVKADWLASANFDVFSRSNLYTKLAGVYQEYGEAAGFAPDLKGVMGAEVNTFLKSDKAAQAERNRFVPEWSYFQQRAEESPT